MSRSLLVLAAILLVLLGVYAAVGFWLVPRVAKDEIESRLADQLGIEAELEHVSFDPFQLELSAGGFAMGESGFRELQVDLDVAPLLRRALVFDAIRLVGATVEMRVSEDGGLQIAGIGLGGEADGEPEPASAEESGSGFLTEIEIRSLSISEGRFRWVDASRSPPFEYELGPIDLEASELGLTGLVDPEAAAGAPSEVHLSIALGEGASLSAEGEVDVEPLLLDLEFSLEGLALSTFQPYAAAVWRAELREGVLGAKGHLRYGEGLAYTGSLAVAQLEVGEPDVEAALLAWRSLDVTGIEIAGPPWKLAIGGIDLAEPGARLVQESRGSNVSRAFSRELSDKDAGPAEPQPVESEPVEIVIGPARIVDGTVSFEDRTIAPAYRVELQTLTASFDRFSAKGGKTKLTASAKVDGYAPVEVNGSLDLLDLRAATDLTAAAKRLELSSFSPYAGRYLGKEIQGGRGSFDAHVKIDGGLVVGENVVVLDGLDLGKAVESPDATSLPVASAAVLLTGADGKIRVDLPVEGDLDDPTFSYGGALLDTARILVLRVAETPFKIVGGMVSLGGRLFSAEDLRTVVFAPGKADLSEAESEELDAIAKAMADDPKLRLEVTGGADPARDGDADHRVLARRRAAAVRERLEAAGLSEERIRTGEVEVGDGLGRARVLVR